MKGEAIAYCYRFADQINAVPENYIHNLETAATRAVTCRPSRSRERIGMRCKSGSRS